MGEYTAHCSGNHLYRLYRKEQLLLSYLAQLGQTFYELPLLDMRLIRYPYFHHHLFRKYSENKTPSHPGSPTEEILVLDWHQKAVTEIEVPFDGVICGRFTIPTDVLNKQYVTRKSELLIRQFQSHYQRYLVYHESRQQFKEEPPVTIIGDDSVVLDALRTAETYVRSELPVLITGETGTGKELWAQLLHFRSTRRNRPFLAVNCAQIREDSLASSHLFGHLKGSFTGVGHHRPGALRQADGGTVLLDEVETLSLDVQALLLRTIESGEIHPVGADAPMTVDLRIIAATNQELRNMVHRGTFREDLYYRLAGHTITLPPLRQRNEWDLEQLALFFLSECNTKNDTEKNFPSKVMDLLTGYHWPGNVRELKHVVTNAWFTSEDRGKSSRKISRRRSGRQERADS
ncbi:MAG TPA: sigma 54-interacting transcriptional regulator [bacterium]|nr:sigma 54-interacting transcriptional regulator [bacterium]